MEFIKTMERIEHKSTILVVDDEEANVSLLEKILVPLGYNVLKAYNGKEALEKICAQNPDLVILDIKMPIMDGLAVCKAMRDREETRFTPVIFITGFGTTELRIKGIEVGGDDFLSKPFNIHEITARVRSLLRMKRYRDDLENAYEHLSNLTAVTDQLLNEFDPMNFDIQAMFHMLVNQLLGGTLNTHSNPGYIFLSTNFGMTELKGSLYARVRNRTKKILDSIIIKAEPFVFPGSGELQFSNRGSFDGTYQEYQRLFDSQLLRMVGKIDNFICYRSKEVVIIALNYNRPVSIFEAQVLKGLVIHSHFFKVISDQIRETENAFLYSIHSLARACEINDEDTGNHILRVNEYTKALSVELSLPEQFIDTISYSAQMHDVGKIHTHPDILKKPGKLSEVEFNEMKKHTIFGPKILGQSPRLELSRQIAESHHENYDGSGYPHGAKGDEIPLSSRITHLADIYDALRSKRVYKPALSNEEAVKIITRGDGRVTPQHFDPGVLKSFKKINKEFQAIYRRLKD